MTIYYRLTTSQPIDTEAFAGFVQKLGCTIPDGEANPLEVTTPDGSIYGIKRMPDRNHGFAYLNAVIYAEGDRVQFGHVTRFGRFCTRNGLGLRRNGIEIDEGTLLSDVMNCEAFRIASHIAQHPTDRQSIHYPAQNTAGDNEPGGEQ